MAAKERTQNSHEVAVEALAGILALMIEEREERLDGNKDAVKVEVLLATLGFTNEDIRAVTGKNLNTIKTTLHRAKAKAG